jgi:hypothetical protein
MTSLLQLLGPLRKSVGHPAQLDQKISGNFTREAVVVLKQCLGNFLAPEASFQQSKGPAMTATRTKRSAIRSMLCVVSIALVLPFASTTNASAKSLASEKPLLKVILRSLFNVPPSAASLNCVAGRLAPGAVAGLAIDINDSFDIADLADSVPFRSVLRNVFLCKPAELVRQFTPIFENFDQMNLRQRQCAAKAFTGRVGANDIALTAFIRSGVGGLTLDELPEEYQAEFGVEILLSIKGCVPASVYNDILNS